jgi:hypothetical protein
MEIEIGSHYDIDPENWKVPYGTIPHARWIIRGNPWKVTEKIFTDYWKLKSGSKELESKLGNVLYVTKKGGEFMVKDPYMEKYVRMVLRKDYTIEVIERILESVVPNRR